MDNIEELAYESAVRLGFPTEYFDRNTDGKMIPCRNGHGYNSPCCSISIKKNMVHCFSCGYGGSLTNLYYEEFGHSIKKDLGIAPTKGNFQNPFFVPKKKERGLSLATTPEANFKFEGETTSVHNVKECMEYLKKRQINEAIIQDFGMKYAVDAFSENSDGERIIFSNRLLIPIYEQKILSMEGRDLYGEQKFNQLKQQGKIKADATYRKCLYPKGSSTSTLFQLNRLNSKKTLYLTEGLMDLATLRGDYRFNNSTTIFGSQPTQRQLYLLEAFNDIVYIYNNDEAGLNSVKKIFKYRNGNLRILAPSKKLPKDGGPCDIGDIINFPINGELLSISEYTNRRWLDNIIKPKSLEMIDYMKGLLLKS